MRLHNRPWCRRAHLFRKHLCFPRRYLLFCKTSVTKLRVSHSCRITCIYPSYSQRSGQGEWVRTVLIRLQIFPMPRLCINFDKLDGFFFLNLGLCMTLDVAMVVTYSHTWISVITLLFIICSRKQKSRRITARSVFPREVSRTLH